MPPSPGDADWLDVAARLALRARPLSRPNPAVGAVVVKDGIVVGRGWTQPGGRPHAEAMALAEAGERARGATCYVTLEPCAHASPRGPACSASLIAAGVARVFVAVRDPDPRTAGRGLAALQQAGVEARLVEHPPARRSLAGYLARATLGRPHVTLKLALSADCRLAPPAGQWLTGEIARAHVHAWRARMDAILVGRGTLDADTPRLDVRLPGLAALSPRRLLLTSGGAPPGWSAIAAPEQISALDDIQWLMVEGGAVTARAFLAANLVDAMMIYRAPHAVGGSGAALPELADDRIGPGWQHAAAHPLGSDRLDVYHRSRCSQA